MTHYLKAIVALFAAPLTYVAHTLTAGGSINVATLLSYGITAVLVWAVPNEPA